MPTKIVDTVSDHLIGVISLTDLNAITGEFKDHISMQSNDDRVITKLNEVSIPIEIVENLIGKVAAADRQNCKMIIRFGVTLPYQKDCKDPNLAVGNHLTVVMLLKNNNAEMLSTGDFIITAGFKEFSGTDVELGDDACCPVINNG